MVGQGSGDRPVELLRSRYAKLGAGHSAVSSSATAEVGSTAVGRSFARASVRRPAPQVQAGVGFGGVQPELSPGLKIVFYVLSFLVPIVGIVLYFVYRNKPAQEDRSAANLFLILGLIAFALSCFCSIVPFLFAPVVNY